MHACWRVTPSLSNEYRRGCCCRAENQQTVSNGLIQFNKKVLVVGSGWAGLGWAGLGAAHHLSKQGLDVTALEGGYDSGPNRLISSPDDFGIRGFWIPYRNIFNLVDELGIKPIMNWMKSAQYSGEGLEVEFPIFQDLPEWPTPSGTLFYTQFIRLPLVDRLTSLPLMAAVVDFDNTDTSWRKYYTITARKLFRQFGCSERLYEDVFNPLVQVGLFAPAERCSAAATLGMLYYILAHQKDFDLVRCHGTVKEKIFDPWMESMRSQGNNSEEFHVNELLPLKDDDVAAKAMSSLSKCVKDFDKATVIDKEIERFPKFLTHFFPGSYKYVMHGSTSFPNLFMAGDWIIPRHGSWSQVETTLQFLFQISSYRYMHFYYYYFSRFIEKNHLSRDLKQRIGWWSILKKEVLLESLPVEEDEPHIQALRSLNRNLNDMIARLPWPNYFIR